MGVAFTLLTILFLVVSVCLVLIILVQRPQGGGLAQAFGGGGGAFAAADGAIGGCAVIDEEVRTMASEIKKRTYAQVSTWISLGLGCVSLATICSIILMLWHYQMT